MINEENQKTKYSECVRNAKWLYRNVEGEMIDPNIWISAKNDPSKDAKETGNRLFGEDSDEYKSFSNFICILNWRTRERKEVNPEEETLQKKNVARYFSLDLSSWHAIRDGDYDK